MIPIPTFLLILLFNHTPLQHLLHAAPDTSFELCGRARVWIKYVLGLPFGSTVGRVSRSNTTLGLPHSSAVGLARPVGILQNNWRRLGRRQMFRISKDNPAFYLTAVTKERLPIFRTEALAQVACDALLEARRSGKFLAFAFVLMPDHFHLVTDSKVESKEVLRFTKGICGRRVIDHLRENGHEDSLGKLRVDRQTDGSDFVVWQRHSNVRLLWNEQMLWQRIQYTHLNPVRAGLVHHPNEWHWSTARIWHGRSLENEPFEVDRSKIEWHR